MIEFIVRRILSLAEEDPTLQSLLVRAAHERQLSNVTDANGSLSRDGSLALAEACEEVAKRLFAKLRPSENVASKGAYL